MITCSYCRAKLSTAANDIAIYSCGSSQIISKDQVRQTQTPECRQSEHDLMLSRINELKMELNNAIQELNRQRVCATKAMMHSESLKIAGTTLYNIAKKHPGIFSALVLNRWAKAKSRTNETQAALAKLPHR